VNVQDYSSIKACSEAVDANFFQIADIVFRQAYWAGGGKCSPISNLNTVSRNTSPCLGVAGPCLVLASPRR